MDRALESLKAISTAPSDEHEFEAWLALEDALRFLRSDTSSDEFVVYAGTQHTFMHAILVPASSVNSPDVPDLMSWNCNASSSWGISMRFTDPPQVWISPPLDHTGSKTLNNGEQLVFARHFEGRLGDKGYFEVLQKFTHIFDLHFLPERNAYCRIDKHGDIEDAIRICTVPRMPSEHGGTVVIFNRAVLDEYLALRDFAIVRTFDFTRYRSSKFGGWSDRSDIKEVVNGDVFYRSHVEPGHASYLRGCQIVRTAATRESVIKRMNFREEEKDRQYASFIAHDWKNNVVKEISCAPDATANYFTKSDLPFETSPAFFRPEVLSKYKADSEKYRLQDRSISCRGAWYLKTYDINAAGQVHTYVVYLRDLPYEEQLHWKAYNEQPKGPISSRAFTTDFEGQWDLTYEPLNSLKEALRELDRKQVPWWKLRSEKLLDQVHYPVTSSADEWANELLQLDQLVVEGFETKWFREKATSLGRNPDPKFGSLKLLGECLIGLGLEESSVREILEPLERVHFLRTKMKGHASGTEATRIKKEVLAVHATFKKHFEELCVGCDQGIRTITEVLA